MADLNDYQPNTADYYPPYMADYQLYMEAFT
jgi:hypothetical protein